MHFSLISISYLYDYQFTMAKRERGVAFLLIASKPSETEVVYQVMLNDILMAGHGTLGKGGGGGQTNKQHIKPTSLMQPHP